MLKKLVIAIGLSIAAAAPVAAEPVTLTTEVSGTADFFSMYDWGFGEVQGQKDVQLTLTARFADWTTSGPNRSVGDVGLAVTYDGVTHRQVLTGTLFMYSYRYRPETPFTVLSQSYSDSSDGEWFFGHRLHMESVYADDVLPPGSLPGAGAPVLTSTDGSFSLGMYFNNDVVDVTVGEAIGSIASIRTTISPVPEPASWAMLAGGLALAGAAARRRARALA